LLRRAELLPLLSNALECIRHTDSSKIAAVDTLLSEEEAGATDARRDSIILEERHRLDFLLLRGGRATESVDLLASRVGLMDLEWGVGANPACVGCLISLLVLPGFVVEGLMATLAAGSP
jgi:hypothetical protein